MIDFSYLIIAIVTAFGVAFGLAFIDHVLFSCFDNKDDEGD